MRASVDAEVCQGHALCTMNAPDLFRLRDDDGLAYVDDETVPPGQEDAARQAAASCPEMAISIED